MNILYEVGAYGPILLALLTWYLLWNRKTLFYYYTVGVVLNSILNIILKMLIQEPRPSVDAQQLELLKRHAHDYFFQNGIPFKLLGMPSGHVQSSIFSAVFIYLSLRENKWLIVYILSALLTAYQRIAMNFHSLYQVIVGGMVGWSFAYFFYTLAREKIKGIIRAKPDDNAPV
jgi:membrane-associated phospholipid phosphatase